MRVLSSFSSNILACHLSSQVQTAPAHVSGNKLNTNLNLYLETIKILIDWNNTRAYQVSMSEDLRVSNNDSSQFFSLFSVKEAKSENFFKSQSCEA